MDRRAFVEQHRYELAGLVLEAQMHPRTGAELATSLRPLFARIDGLLGAAWDAANGVEPTPPHVNGKPAVTRRVT